MRKKWASIEIFDIFLMELCKIQPKLRMIAEIREEILTFGTDRRMDGHKKGRTDAWNDNNTRRRRLRPGVKPILKKFRINTDIIIKCMQCKLLLSPKRITKREDNHYVNNQIHFKRLRPPPPPPIFKILRQDWQHFARPAWSLIYFSLATTYS